MKGDLLWMTEVSPGDRRRRAKQVRKFIASRTDSLDAWFLYEQGVSDQPAPKPEIKGSPTIPLARVLQERGDFGWCSIGATLLSGSTRTQEAFVATPHQLIDHARVDGKGHHVARPYGSSRSDAWLLVWAVEDTSANIDEVIKLLGDYIKAKKYQLKVSRAVAFVFDSTSADLHTVLYDGSSLVADAHLEDLVRKLHPADKWQKSIPKTNSGKRGKRR